MILKRYQKELIVALSLLLLLIALVYKSTAVNSNEKNISMGAAEVREFKELLSLKKRWLNKKTSKNVDKLQKLVPASKLTWKKKGKKLTVIYSEITPKELDKVVTTILNLSVQIQTLDIMNTRESSPSSYNVELKCKW
jgi:hypothetical protein